MIWLIYENHNGKLVVSTFKRIYRKFIRWSWKIKQYFYNIFSVLIRDPLPRGSLQYNGFGSLYFFALSLATRSSIGLLINEIEIKYSSWGPFQIVDSDATKQCFLDEKLSTGLIQVDLRSSFWNNYSRMN